MPYFLNLEQVRNEAGITRSALARLASRHRSTIYRAENHMYVMTSSARGIEDALTQIGVRPGTLQIVQERPAVLPRNTGSYTEPNGGHFQTLVSKLKRFQTYDISTPLKNDLTLYSFSIVIRADHNRLRPLESLLNEDLGARFTIDDADGFDDFVDFLLGDHSALAMRADFLSALDTDYSILFRGSINPVTPSTLSKLPTLLKGFASLSGKQFRVGLFRVSTTIIVITVAVSGTIIALEVIRELAVHTVQKLIGD